MKYKNIHSLEDIQKAKHHLKKSIRLAERSFTERTVLGKILLNDNEKSGSLLSEDKGITEMFTYLLPLGIKHIIKLMQKKSNKKHLKRILIYSAAGSLLAFSVYKLIMKQQDDKEE